MELLDFSELLITKIFTVFDSASPHPLFFLKFELPYALFQIKLVSLQRAVEHSYSLPLPLDRTSGSLLWSWDMESDQLLSE